MTNVEEREVNGLIEAHHDLMAKIEVLRCECDDRIATEDRNIEEARQCRNDVAEVYRRGIREVWAQVKQILSPGMRVELTTDSFKESVDHTNSDLHDDVTDDAVVPRPMPGGERRDEIGWPQHRSHATGGGRVSCSSCARTIDVTDDCVVVIRASFRGAQVEERVEYACSGTCEAHVLVRGATATSTELVKLRKNDIYGRSRGLTPRQAGALRAILTRVGSWTAARWDQHLRYDVGDEDANAIIAWLDVNIPNVKEGP